MNKPIKKIVCTLLLAMSVTSVTAFAETQGFDFSLARGARGFVGPATKADNEQTSYITTQSGDIISSDQVYMRVRDSNYNYATEAIQVTSNSARYTTPYIQTGYAGDSYYLACQTDVWSVNVAGAWTP